MNGWILSAGGFNRLADRTNGVNSRYRDGLLAAGVAVGLLGGAAVTGGSPTSLIRPLPIVAGAFGALMLELLLARVPNRSRALWERPAVQVAGVVVTVGIGLGSLWLDRDVGMAVVAALLGGSVAYVLLLGGVSIGVVPPPGKWFEPET